MKALKRYLLLLLTFLILCGIYRAFFNHEAVPCVPSFASQSSNTGTDYLLGRKSYYTLETHKKFFYSYSVNNVPRNATKAHGACHMGKCFDFSRCKQSGENVKIYIYPNDGQNASPTFMKIINFIKNSKYYEPDPNKACLYISDIDTLDRDPLSVDFKKYGKNKPLLNMGFNHIMFNLYSGTWPLYSELDFSNLDYPPHAILVKASMSVENYRKGFDISFPLISKNHPERGSQQPAHEMAKINFQDKPNVEIIRKEKVRSTKYLLVFKGKRYIYGIGSETRNSLHHLHNHRDILIYTTCKHGKKWKDLVDDRCEQDNLEYDKHDYQTLMTNSTFCLVPRGRRLGSFRFLEALSMGCIPVVLSNSWVLPFSEVIDWSTAVVIADERLLFQIPDQIRSISPFAIETMRAQCIYLYNTYFSSLERIITTAITIIEDRINSHWARESFLWNVANQSPLSPLWLVRNYSDQISHFPSYSTPVGVGFSAVVPISRVISIFQLTKFLKASLMSCKYVRKILLLWTLKSPVSPQIMQIAAAHPALVTIEEISEGNGTNGQHARFTCCVDYASLPTDAIFQLDPESNLIPEEIDFAYLVWESFPERVVGFSARDHYFDSSINQWTYTSKWTNQYSIVLLDAAVYHKYYNFLFQQHILSSSSLISMDFDEECSGIAFNFLISHITRQSPIKVTQRKKTVSSETLLNSWMAWIDRKSCFHKLINMFGYIPLVKSIVRMEPLLYKDAVAAQRKKYLKLEQTI